MTTQPELHEERRSASDTFYDGEKGSDPVSVHINPLVPDPDDGLSKEERAKNERKLLWKLDVKFIPWLTFLYLISFLDRTNIGNAKLVGLLEGAHLTQNQFNTGLTIFFVSYGIFEPLTNVLVKRFRPPVVIAATMFVWGVCMTCMGLVSSFGGLVAARWFLGVAEAALFPAVAFLMSCWYKRTEYGVRIAILFSGAALSGSFGGLLAAAISKMAGVGGKMGWSWIFIIEGLATVLVAMASYWLVPDFPERGASTTGTTTTSTSSFLSPDDQARAIRRLTQDEQSSARQEDFSMRHVVAAYTDWKTYLYSAIFIGHDMPLYAFSLFLPSIINELGYSSIRAQLLSVPPYAAGCIATVCVGLYADRVGRRGPVQIAFSLIGILGFALLLADAGPAVSYAGTFLGAVGIYPCVANNVSWIGNNFEGVYKRGIVLGTAIMAGNVSGVISSNIYRARDAPAYVPGHATVLAFLAVLLLGGSVAMELLLRRENRRRERGGRDYLVVGKTAEEVDALGDWRPGFRYVL